MEFAGFQCDTIAASCDWTIGPGHSKLHGAAYGRPSKTPSVTWFLGGRTKWRVRRYVTQLLLRQNDKLVQDIMKVLPTGRASTGSMHRWCCGGKSSRSVSQLCLSFFTSLALSLYIYFSLFGRFPFLSLFVHPGLPGSSIGVQNGAYCPRVFNVLRLIHYHALLSLGVRCSGSRDRPCLRGQLTLLRYMRARGVSAYKNQLISSHRPDEFGRQTKSQEM